MPFLKNFVSGELMYFAKLLLSSIFLPPIPNGFEVKEFIGNNNLPLNLSTNIFFLSSKRNNPVSCKTFSSNLFANSSYTFEFNDE